MMLVSWFNLFSLLSIYEKPETMRPVKVVKAGEPHLSAPLLSVVAFPVLLMNPGEWGPQERKSRVGQLTRLKKRISDGRDISRTLCPSGTFIPIVPFFLFSQAKGQVGMKWTPYFPPFKEPFSHVHFLTNIPHLLSSVIDGRHLVYKGQLFFPC